MPPPISFLELAKGFRSCQPKAAQFEVMEDVTASLTDRPSVSLDRVRVALPYANNAHKLP